MAIKKFYTKNPRPGWKFDRQRKEFWSWGFDAWVDGRNSKRLREHGFATESDAISALGRLRSRQREERHGLVPSSGSHRLQALVDKHLEAIRERKEHPRAKRVLTNWLGLLPKDIKLSSLRTKDISLYVSKRFKEKRSPSTIDRELNIISACLNAADRYFEELRQWRPPRIPRPQFSQKPRKRVVTQFERQKLISYLLAPRMKGEQLQSAIARHRAGRRIQFAFLVGCRHSEMLRIKKIHVDWDRRNVKIEGTKADKDRTVQLPATAFRILEEAAKESLTPYVFGSPNICWKFYRILKRACKACGIPYGQRVADGIVLHDARHTVTTILLQEGVDPATVQEQMGWSQREFLLWYSHSTPDSRSRAASILERFGGQMVDKIEESDQIN